jgi:hypothetical protein
VVYENDPAFKLHLAVDSRFGDKINFSWKTVGVSNAIHAEGLDAHRVSKLEVLRMAMRVLKIGGSSSGAAPVKAPPAPEPEPVAPPVARKPEAKPKVVKAKAPVALVKPVAAKAAPVVKKAVAAKPVAAKAAPAKVESKPAPVKAVKASAKAKALPEPAPEEDPGLPETELPPEKQPLRLPPMYNPKTYPHYDVQQSVYAMLLSALSLANHFEKLPGLEERQKKLEAIMKEYLDTCENLKNLQQ